MSIVPGGRINFVNATGGSNNAVVAYFAPQKSPPHWFSEFYRGGSYVGAGVSVNVPVSGIIWLSSFYSVSTVSETVYVLDTTPVRYPPVGVGGNTANPATVALSERSYGNGSYIMMGSSSYGNGVHPVCAPFDYDTSTWPTGAWGNLSASGYMYNGTTGAYIGSSSTTVSGTSHLGEWVQIKLPYPIVLKNYALVEVAERMSTSFILAGSTDGTTWTTVSAQTPVQTSATGNNSNMYSLVANTTPYSYYRFIPKSISTRNQYGFVGVYEIELYGYASGTPTIVLGNGTKLNGTVSGKRSSGSSQAWHNAVVVDGMVYTWGYNTYGMIGDGSTAIRFTPTPVTGGSLTGKTAVAVARGAYHTLALDSTGGVHAWGYGANGRLGIGNTDNSFTPVAVTGGSLSGKTVYAIAAGGHFSLALDSTGGLHGWGANWAGQLGDGGSGDKTSPYAITGGSLASRTVVGMAAGDSYTVAVGSTGTVHVFGQNDNGQLGTGGTAYSRSPTEVTISGKTIVAVGCGFAHTHVITSDGLLYGCGGNANGRVGDGIVTSGNRTSYVQITGSLNGKTVIGVSHGDPMSYALDSTGGVHAWGANSGRLGDGQSADQYAPIAITGGTLSGKVITSISSSRDGWIGLDNSNQIHVFGLNTYGELGTGNSNTTSLPILSFDFKGTSNVQVVNGGGGGVSEEALYAFTSNTFMNAGVTGKDGPTLAQIQSAYSANTWASDTNNLNMTTQGVQIWTVPYTGVYAFTVAGACGGTSYNTPGNGAVLTASNVPLNKNDKLYLVVGQRGASTGGGGASWVFYNTVSTASLYFVAGGGGAGGYNAYTGPGSANAGGRNAELNNNGTSGYNSTGASGGAGGSAGNPGNGGGGVVSGTIGSSGVGGIQSSGQNYDGIGGSGGGGALGIITSTTFVGGSSGMTAAGGFGGGGAGGGDGWGHGGGGGGGYSGGGGGAGGNSRSYGGSGGGGGGSYYFSANYFSSWTATNTGEGYITIIGTPTAGSSSNTSSNISSNSNITLNSNVAIFTSLSSTAVNSAVGIYSLYAITGSNVRVIQIRRSSDNVTQDFWADSSGNLTTTAPSGIPISTWLGEDTGYVTTWYDQSPIGNHATQTTTASQPTINITNKYIDFRTNAYFNLPDNTIPSGNANYTIMLKHNTFSNNPATFISSGTTGTTGYTNSIEYSSSITYNNFWWSNDVFTTTWYSLYQPGNIVTAKYKNTSGRSLYVNGLIAASGTTVNRASTTLNNAIAYESSRSRYLNGELHYLYIFNTDLSDSDLLLLRQPTSNVYPPSALTANVSTISGMPYGNGQYTVSASSSYGTNQEYLVFNKKIQYGDGWSSASQPYSSATGIYTGATGTVIGGTTYNGEWLQIQLPTYIPLSAYDLVCNYGINDGGVNKNRTANTWYIAGSSNGSTWSMVDSREGVPYTTWSDASFAPTFTLASPSTAYQYYRFVCKTINVPVQYTFSSVSEWVLYAPVSTSNVVQDNGGGGGGTVQSVTYYPNAGDVSPSFITLYGTTDYTGQTGWNQRIDGSYHSLHPNSYSATSGIYYSDLSLGSSFTMSFDWYYGKASCCFAADGLKILLYANSTMVDPSTGVGTSGWGGRTYEGYSILIERYNYLSQRYVQILYNNAEVYKSGTFVEPGLDVFRTFTLVYNAGVFTVTLNGTTIGSYTHGVTATYTNSYFGIFGVSGGDPSEQRIRNLIISRN